MRERISGIDKPRAHGRVKRGFSRDVNTLLLLSYTSTLNGIK